MFENLKKNKILFIDVNYSDESMTLACDVYNNSFSISIIEYVDEKN